MGERGGSACFQRLWDASAPVSVIESAKPARTLTVLWTGRRWTVDCPVPTERLQPHYPLPLELPDEAVRWRLLFEPDTCLYLPLRVTRRRSAIDALITRHFSERGLRVPTDDGRSYIPGVSHGFYNSRLISSVTIM
jgi:hypothetical protein